MTVLLFGGGFVYADRRKGLELSGWCAAFMGGALLDAALRLVVRRSELPFADIVLLDWGTGLASGHLLGVLVGYGMLAYFVCSFIRNAAARMLIIVLAIALGFSDRDLAPVSGATLSERRERRRGCRVVVADGVCVGN
jgi:hypothetical protein